MKKIIISIVGVILVAAIVVLSGWKWFGWFSPKTAAPVETYTEPAVIQEAPSES